MLWFSSESENSQSTDIGTENVTGAANASTAHTSSTNNHAGTINEPNI